jgi:hypothetical protein
MGTPGSCKAEDIDAAAPKAEATGHKYAPVFVTVTKQVSPSEIEIAIWGVKTPFTVHWGDTSVMWAACPSSLPSQAVPDNPGKLPAVGAAGILYLSDTFLTSNSINETPKWPYKMPDEPLTAEIEVLPQSLLLTATYPHNGKQATIELLDRGSSSREQTIELSKTKLLKVQLTQSAFTKLGAEFDPGEQALDDAIDLLGSGKGSPEASAAAWRVIAAAADLLATASDSTSDRLTSLRKRLAGLTVTRR